MAEDVVITVRVPQKLVQRVRKIAASRDETMSQIIRRSLRGYAELTPIENKDAV